MLLRDRTAIVVRPRLGPRAVRSRRALNTAAILTCLAIAGGLEACSYAAGTSYVFSTNDLRGDPGGIEEVWISEKSITDVELSRYVTERFHESGLPVAGASLCRDDSGNSVAILYGFVALPSQRDNAEDEVREIVGDPYFPISDRIKVRPELLAVSNNSYPSSESSERGKSSLSSAK